MTYYNALFGCDCYVGTDTPAIIDALEEKKPVVVTRSVGRFPVSALACLPSKSSKEKKYQPNFSLSHYPCWKGKDCTATCPGCNATSKCIAHDEEICKRHGLAGYSLCYICNVHMCIADPEWKCKNRKYIMSRCDDSRFAICSCPCLDILNYVVPVNTLWILSKKGDLPLTKDVITVIFNLLRKLR